MASGLDVCRWQAAICCQLGAVRIPCGQRTLIITASCWRAQLVSCSWVWTLHCAANMCLQHSISHNSAAVKQRHIGFVQGTSILVPCASAPADRSTCHDCMCCVFVLLQVPASAQHRDSHSPGCAGLLQQCVGADRGAVCMPARCAHSTARHGRGVSKASNAGTARSSRSRPCSRAAACLGQSSMSRG